MKALLDVLPRGTMKEISEELDIDYNTVANTCYGKHYNKEVVNEVERRYKAVKKSLTVK